jgi:hypothetical protein
MKRKIKSICNIYYNFNTHIHQIKIQLIIEMNKRFLINQITDDLNLNLLEFFHLILKIVKLIIKNTKKFKENFDQYSKKTFMM